MSNACCTSEMSLRFTPLFCIPANNSHSLPKPQLPTFLPPSSAGSVMLAPLKEIWVVALRSKICATSVILAPFSIEPSTFGTHEIA